MKIWPDIEQGSEEWFKQRLGRPTASRFKEIITPGGKLSDSADKYAAELVIDSIDHGQPPSFIGNDATERGNMMEGDACLAFEAHTGLMTHKIGFITHEKGYGCSPDRLITLAGGGPFIAGLEVKCPYPKKHAQTVMEGILPAEHKAQVHGGMVVTSLREWHFFSYTSPVIQPFHCVVRWDDYTEKVQTALNAFVQKCRALREELIPKLRIAAPAAQEAA